MPNRFISGTSAVGMVLGFISLTTLPTAGQAPEQMNKTATSAARSDLPRMPDGHPDLQGTYDLATMTPLERLPGDPAFLTREQAIALQRAEIARRAKDDLPSDPDRPAPPVGGDTSAPKSFFEALEKAGGGAVGGYNRFWLNQGAAYTEVAGQIRTSIVVDPPNGHLPPYNEAARKRIARPRHRLRRNGRTAQPSRPAPTTTRSSGRSPSAACSDSAPRPARRPCRIISTTICIRLCRPRTRS